MDIVSLANKLGTISSVKNIAVNEYEIITGAKINAKNPIKIYLVMDGDAIKLSDKKGTLKFMNSIYELKAPDVRNCISAVVKIYGFTINAGELNAVIRSEESLKEIFYNFIICIGQLVNMYAFFDKPE